MASGILRPHPDEDRADWERSVITRRASALGLEPPVVSRFHCHTGLSGLRWGDEEPEWVFIHGSRLDAHTWDRVALALGRPALAIDLPGHGWSKRYPDGAYTLDRMSSDVAATIRELAPRAVTVVGHSLGGSVSIGVVERLSDVTNGLVLLDVVPRATPTTVPPPSVRHRGTLAELAASATESTDPTVLARAELSVRLNARSHDGTTWEWLWDPRVHQTIAQRRREQAGLLEVTKTLRCRGLVIRGAESRVLDEATASAFHGSHQHLELDTAPAAGHHIHRDNPEWLVARLRSFTRGPGASTAPLSERP